MRPKKLSHTLENDSYTDKGCKIWKWARSEKGYGVLRIEGRNLLAHRFYYTLYNGAIPRGLCVLHRCDNRLCVNPKHLFLGTVADNQRDAVNKGRIRKGEKHGRAKLRRKDVRTIRKDYKKGEVGSAVSLARQLKVNRATITAIARGESWGWLI